MYVWFFFTLVDKLKNIINRKRYWYLGILNTRQKSLFCDRKSSHAFVGVFEATQVCFSYVIFLSPTNTLAWEIILVYIPYIVTQGQHPLNLLHLLMKLNWTFKKKTPRRLTTSDSPPLQNFTKVLYKAPLYLTSTFPWYHLAIQEARTTQLRLMLRGYQRLWGKVWHWAFYGGLHLFPFDTWVPPVPPLLNFWSWHWSM